MDIETAKTIAPYVLALGLAIIGHFRIKMILESDIKVLKNDVLVLQAEVVKCRGDRNYLEELLDQQAYMDSTTFNDKLTKVQAGLRVQGLELTVREVALLAREHGRLRENKSA